MSDHPPPEPRAPLPPPGWAPPGPTAQPGWGAPSAPGGPYAPGVGQGHGYAGAPWIPAPVHKPGIVALRPLGLGDIYDGAFKSIRQNPRAMIGMSVLVVTGFLLLPTLASVLLAAAGELTGPLQIETDAEGNPETLPVSVLMTYAGQLLGGLAGLMLTGMIVHVVAQAVLGHRSTAGETWRAVRGRLLALLGLTIVVGLLFVVPVAFVVGIVVALALTAEPVVAIVAGVVLVPVLLVAVVWLHVRLGLLASPALVLERVGIVRSMQRSFVLSKGQFWRLFGIYLLTAMVVGLVGGMLGLPFTLIAMFGSFLVPESASGLVYVFSTYLGLVVTYALTTPFTSAVVALQYVDQRIRKEAFDVELLSRAGELPVPPARASY